jgi:hypothetical protein
LRFIRYKQPHDAYRWRRWEKRHDRRLEDPAADYRRASITFSAANNTMLREEEKCNKEN